MNNRQHHRRFLSTISILMLGLTACNNADKYADLGWEEINKIRAGQKKDASIALNYLDQALEADSNHVRALHGVGEILGSNEHTRKKGIMRLRRAIELDPLYAPAYVDLAKIMKAAGQKGAALDVVEEGLQINPKNVALLIARAGFLGDAGQFNEAENSLTAAEKLDPGNARIAFQRAIVKVQQKQEQKAVNWFRKAIELNDKEPDYLAGLARILLYRKTQMDERLYDLQNAKKKTAEDNTKIQELQTKVTELENEARTLVDQALKLNTTHSQSLALRYNVLDKESSDLIDISDPEP